VKWPGGLLPTLTNVVGKIDIISMYFDGTSYYANASTDFN
jgi:hypothetical protein